MIARNTTTDSPEIETAGGIELSDQAIEAIASLLLAACGSDGQDEP